MISHYLISIIWDLLAIWIFFNHLPMSIIRAHSGCYLPKNVQNFQNGPGHKWGCPDCFYQQKMFEDFRTLQIIWLTIY